MAWVLVCGGLVNLGLCVGPCVEWGPSSGVELRQIVAWVSVNVGLVDLGLCVAPCVD